MSFAPNVFVSSACRELRDLRAAVRDWLCRMGFNPILSEVDGFPHMDGMPPWASCLKTMDECALVVGVVEGYYGQPFDDWGPFLQYRGLAPTHAELRHVLDTGKRVLIYVHDDTWKLYDVWRKNPSAFVHVAPSGMDVRTLEMFHELRTRNPIPWISRYSNSSSLIESLKKEIINQLYLQLREREKETADLKQYLLTKLDEAPPDVGQGIAEALNAELVEERDALLAKVGEIDAALRQQTGASDEKIHRLEQEKAAVELRLSGVSQQVALLANLLAHSAAMDAVWLERVRRTMMPKQPGRAPFHNSLEVALRGYHASPGRRVVPSCRR